MSQQLPDPVLDAAMGIINHQRRNAEHMLRAACEYQQQAAQAAKEARKCMDEYDTKMQLVNELRAWLVANVPPGKVEFRK